MKFKCTITDKETGKKIFEDVFEGNDKVIVAGKFWRAARDTATHNGGMLIQNGEKVSDSNRNLRIRMKQTEYAIGEKVLKVSEAKARANSRYNKAHTKPLYVRFNENTDADILEWLETVGNKQGYIKALIRSDIEKQKNKK